MMMATAVAEPTSAVELARVKKNAGEDLVLRWNTWQGETYLDLRVFTRDTSGGPGEPTKKGVCLKPETWEAILPAIQAALGGERSDQDAGEEREA